MLHQPAAFGRPGKNWVTCNVDVLHRLFRVTVLHPMYERGALYNSRRPWVVTLKNCYALSLDPMFPQGTHREPFVRRRSRYALRALAIPY